MRKKKAVGWYGVCRKVFYLIFLCPFELLREALRRNEICKKYTGIKKYHNIHQGKRCFIVATGPSLTQEDYILLKDEITIGVNGLCLWFDELKLETNYFVVSDDDVYGRVGKTLEETKKTKVFISERVCKTQEVNTRFLVFPVNIWNRFMTNITRKKFSKDFAVCSYDEETVVFHAIQLAVYMGITEIYLIGTDCNYKQTKIYAVDHGKKVDQDVGNKMLLTYEIVRNYEEKCGFKVFNATRGGMLEVFPRVCLEEIIVNVI